MKNLNIYLLVFFAGMCVACEDFLDPNTDNTMDEETVFANAAYFCGPLMDAYDALPDYFDIEMDNMTDNSVNGTLSGDYYLCGTGALRPDLNPLNNWTNAYQQIRRLNQFLEKMVLNSDPEAALPTPVRFYKLVTKQDTLDNIREFYRLYGEAHFLRALYQSELLRNFGGVAVNGQVLGMPLVGYRVLEVTENLNLPRATYADCVDAIVSDCDTAIRYLPIEYKGTDRITGQSMNGRASGISAMALKARVLLYAASPAFNSANDKELWVKAATAAGDAIKAVGGGFQDLINAPTTEIGAAYYFNQLQDKTWNDNGKDLFFRSTITSNNRKYESDNYPESMYGSATTNPSQNFIDAFPDKNGYPVSESTIYDPSNPYVNRDPRLALYIAFNGSKMGPGGYHTVESYIGGTDAYIPLKKTSRTSYYLKKLLRNGTVSLIPGNLVGTARTNIILGKPELYLNYAEAANEAWGAKQDPLGFGFTAYSVLQKVHKKYGSADDYLNNAIGNDADKFRLYVHNERRLELSFEGHYYYDLRRWISDKSLSSLNQSVYGMEITKKADGTFEYKRVLIEKRDFKSPYQPIPYNELYNAPALIQNYGWE